MNCLREVFDYRNECDRGDFTHLDRLKELLAYQFDGEMSINTDRQTLILRWEHRRNRNRAQSLLEDCRRQTTFMNGRNLWQYMIEHDLSPQDIGSTREEIKRLADASFHFGIEDASDDNPNINHSDTMD